MVVVGNTGDGAIITATAIPASNSKTQCTRVTKCLFEIDPVSGKLRCQ